MGFIWAMSEIALITLENFCVDGIVRLRSIQALKDLLATSSVLRPASGQLSWYGLFVQWLPNYSVVSAS